MEWYVERTRCIDDGVYPMEEVQIGRAGSWVRALCMVRLAWKAFLTPGQSTIILYCSVLPILSGWSPIAREGWTGMTPSKNPHGRIPDVTTSQPCSASGLVNGAGCRVKITDP